MQGFERAAVQTIPIVHRASRNATIGNFLIINDLPGLKRLKADSVVIQRPTDDFVIASGSEATQLKKRKARQFLAQGNSLGLASDSNPFFRHGLLRCRSQ
jgi:hypothetical protein